jgi:hypothetical protein
LLLRYGGVISGDLMSSISTAWRKSLHFLRFTPFGPGLGAGAPLCAKGLAQPRNSVKLEATLGKLLQGNDGDPSNEEEPARKPPNLRSPVLGEE